MKNNLHTYVYEGPVRSFSNIISNKWMGQTVASSEKKALANLTYQYKISHGLLPSAKITLSGKLTRL